jgi:transcriptional regulator GlxA family with amidase domain
VSATAQRGQAQLSVAFVLAPEFTLMALTAFIEALRHAADEADRSRQIRCRWTILGPDRQPVRSSCGVEITPWQTFDDPSQFDYVAVVGGLLRAHRLLNSAITAYLKRAAAAGVPLVGVCTGSFILARAGLMRERRCCVSYHHINEFAAEFPNIPTQADTLFTIDRDRITCAGGGAVVDLAIHLIEKHCGRDAALKCVSQMVIEERRRHNHPQSHVGGNWPSSITNPLIRRAFLQVQVSMSRPLTVRDLAASFGVGVRQLERVFRSELRLSPAAFIKRMRVEHGCWLLTHTHKSITEIAFECGFADSSHFARTCQAVLGKAPRQLREQSGSDAERTK